MNFVNRIPLSLLSLLWAKGPHPALENLVFLQPNVEVSSAYHPRAIYVCVYHTVLTAMSETFLHFLCIHSLSQPQEILPPSPLSINCPPQDFPFMDTRHQHCRNAPISRMNDPTAHFVEGSKKGVDVSTICQPHPVQRTFFRTNLEEDLGG